MNSFKGKRYCKECDNMLYPKEQLISAETNQGRLIYDCRICGYFEKAQVGDEDENCVYKSDFGKISEGLTIDSEIIKDPTLSRRKGVICLKCNNNEAVMFTQPTKDRMNLIFVCTRCANHWKKEELDENDILSADEDD